YRDIAFLRSTAAAGATDPVVRARLEREAREAAAAADGYAARAAELADGNEPWEEVEIQQQVDQARVAATHDVLDNPGETSEQLRRREIADATMLSYLTWQQEGIPPEEIAQRLERVSPIGAKAVSDYEQLITIGYDPDDARAMAADTATQDPIPAQDTTERVATHDTEQESTVDTNNPGPSAQAEAAAVRRRNNEATYQADEPQLYVSAEPDSPGTVVGRIDQVLSEEDSERARLTDPDTESRLAGILDRYDSMRAECAHLLKDAEARLQRGDDAEDAERAERCARWNAEDEAAAEDVDDKSEGWEQP
ncbi:hypothetical protein, partial [Amycolatopsis regifaucium]